MQCQIHIQKGQLFFKSACQVHHSPECGFENGWRERRREKPETDRGGRSRRPVDIPAHLSDSHLPQRVNVPTALCLLHGRLAAPPLLVQSCIGALCLHWASGTHQSPQGSWRDRSASVCEAELWLYWWTVLPPRQPTTAWSAAGSRGGGRNAASAKVFLCTVPAALLCCLSVCMAVCLSVCLSVRRREWLQNCAAIGAIVLVLFDCHHRRSDESLRAPLWNWSVSFRVACVVHVVMTLFALH